MSAYGKGRCPGEMSVSHTQYAATYRSKSVTLIGNVVDLSIASTVFSGFKTCGFETSLDATFVNNQRDSARDCQ